MSGIFSNRSSFFTDISFSRSIFQTHSNRKPSLQKASHSGISPSLPIFAPPVSKSSGSVFSVAINSGKFDWQTFYQTPVTLSNTPEALEALTLYKDMLVQQHRSFTSGLCASLRKENSDLLQSVKRDWQALLAMARLPFPAKGKLVLDIPENENKGSRVITLTDQRTQNRYVLYDFKSTERTFSGLFKDYPAEVAELIKTQVEEVIREDSTGTLEFLYDPLTQQLCGYSEEALLYDPLPKQVTDKMASLFSQHDQLADVMDNLNLAYSDATPPEVLLAHRDKLKDIELVFSLFTPHFQAANTLATAANFLYLFERLGVTVNKGEKFAPGIILRPIDYDKKGVFKTLLAFRKEVITEDSPLEEQLLWNDYVSFQCRVIIDTLVSHADAIKTGESPAPINISRLLECFNLLLDSACAVTPSPDREELNPVVANQRENLAQLRSFIKNQTTIIRAMPGLSQEEAETFITVSSPLLRFMPDMDKLSEALVRIEQQHIRVSGSLDAQGTAIAGCFLFGQYASKQLASAADFFEKSSISGDSSLTNGSADQNTGTLGALTRTGKGKTAEDAETLFSYLQQTEALIEDINRAIALLTKSHLPAPVPPGSPKLSGTVAVVSLPTPFKPKHLPDLVQQHGWYPVVKALSDSGQLDSLLERLDSSGTSLFKKQSSLSSKILPVPFDELFWKAVQLEDRNVIRSLLQRPGVSATSAQAALYEVLDKGNTSLARFLIGLLKPDNIRKGYSNGSAFLVKAAQSGDPELVKLLLTSGIQPDARDEKTGLSAREAAAKAGHAAVLAVMGKESPLLNTSLHGDIFISCCKNALDGGYYGALASLLQLHGTLLNETTVLKPFLLLLKTHEPKTSEARTMVLSMAAERLDSLGLAGKSADIALAEGMESFFIHLLPHLDLSAAVENEAVMSFLGKNDFAQVEAFALKKSDVALSQAETIAVYNHSDSSQQIRFIEKSLKRPYLFWILTGPERQVRPMTAGMRYLQIAMTKGYGDVVSTLCDTLKDVFFSKFILSKGKFEFEGKWSPNVHPLLLLAHVPGRMAPVLISFIQRSDVWTSIGLRHGLFSAEELENPLFTDTLRKKTWQYIVNTVRTSGMSGGFATSGTGSGKTESKGYYGKGLDTVLHLAAKTGRLDLYRMFAAMVEDSQAFVNAATETPGDILLKRLLLRIGITEEVLDKATFKPVQETHYTPKEPTKEAPHTETVIARHRSADALKQVLLTIVQPHLTTPVSGLKERDALATKLYDTLVTGFSHDLDIDSMTPEHVISYLRSHGAI